MVERNQTATAMGALAILVGVIVIVSPLFGGGPAPLGWLHVVLGAALIITGAYVVREARMGRYVAWAGIALAVVGVAVLTAPLLWKAGAAWHAWLNYVTGALLIMAGGYDAYRASSEDVAASGAVVEE